MEVGLGGHKGYRVRLSGSVVGKGLPSDESTYFVQP
jgi:hypothetical protein